MEIKDSVNLIGVYQINKMADVHLIEMMINQSPIEVDVSSFTQKNDELSEDEWQTAYDEHYLNKDGEEVIGRFGDQHSLSKFNFTRIAFFMYFVDFNKPLLTQYGEVLLEKPIYMPERLLKIIDFIPISNNRLLR
ncbi:MAG: hypothetical protein FWF18_02705 [Dehalococcoidia bacterium]|nr:hypothetical protein [Dehalococcoidia bacterium]